MEVFGREWCHAYIWTVNGSALWTFTRDRQYWAGVYEVRIPTQCQQAAFAASTSRSVLPIRAFMGHHLHRGHFSTAS